MPPIFGEEWGIFPFFLGPVAIEARAVRNRLPAKSYNVKKILPRKSVSQILFIPKIRNCMISLLN